MTLEGGRHHVLHGSRQHVVGSAVLLLVDRLQLTLEQAEHGVEHALRVQPAPLLEELRRKGVVIFRAVPRRRGVQAGAAVLRYQTVELVGYGVVGSPLAQPADVVLNLQPPGGVLRQRQFVVLRRYGVEPLLLGGVVDSADFLRALEQHMLQIVCNARIGTVLRTSPDHQRPVNLRLRVVLVEPHRQPVAQADFLHLTGVAIAFRPYPAGTCRQNAARRNKYDVYSIHIGLKLCAAKLAKKLQCTKFQTQKTRQHNQKEDVPNIVGTSSWKY